MSPRWHKAFRDLTTNRARTLLVLMSITVGVFAIGLVLNAQAILMRELPRSYLTARPSTAVLYTAAFDEDLLPTVRNTRGVMSVEGRRGILVRMQVAPNVWRNLQLFAIQDFHHMQADVIHHLSGRWPPPKDGFLIERSALDLVPGAIGSRLRVETDSGKQRTLTISGVVHDLVIYPANLSGVGYGYITYDTLEALVGSRNFSELHIVMAPDIRSTSAIQSVLDRIRKKVEGAGVLVGGAWIPPYVDKPPVHDIIQTLVRVLGLLGVLSLLLSVLLIANIISALLAQQMRQIGVMKAIGARLSQLVMMYCSIIVLLGSVAALIAIPLSSVGALIATRYIARFLNYDIISFQIPAETYVIQFVVGVCVPLLATFYPVFVGTRITIREAISSSGVSGGFGAGYLDRLTSHVHLFPRTLLLSLRNTIRRKGRLALTLLTLTLAGAIFIATLSVSASATQTFLTAAQYWNYDVQISLAQFYLFDQVAHPVRQVPGVVQVEGWIRASARRLRADGHEGNALTMTAPTAGTLLIQPRVLRGRWLLPADQGAIVINSDVLKVEPDIELGDTITLMVNDRKTFWHVVGIATGQFTGPIVYTNYPAFSRELRSVGRTNFAVITTSQHDAAFRNTVAQALDEHMKRAGLHITQVQTTNMLFNDLRSQFNIVVIFLFIMALLLGVVGALGLMGTMSLNVLERTREIGVMRAIGASNRSIFQIVIMEGVFIGLISWVFGTLLAIPIGFQMSGIVGQALLQTPLDYTLSFASIGLWLVAVVVLAVLASGVPAWNAMRVQVRDVLAYE